MSGTHNLSGRFTDKGGNYRDGSLLKKKQEEWAQDEEYSSPSRKAENEGGDTSSLGERRRKDPHNYESQAESFNNETKQDSDILLVRRKLESSISQLETKLGLVNRGNTEAIKKIEEHRNQIQELQREVKVEQHNRESILEEYLNMKKCAAELQSKREGLEAAMDEAVRSGRQAGRDAHQSVSRCDGLTAEAHSLSAIEHEVDNELVEIHQHLDQTINELRSCGERSKVAMAHAATLFEQIRHEEQSVMQSDHMRKSLEARIKEMQARLDDVEAAALKGDNKLIDAFESRIHEMEGELDSEQRRYEDANKKLSEHDRHVRELRRQIEDDKKDANRAHDLIDQLQKKLKLQGKRSEEAVRSR